MDQTIIIDNAGPLAIVEENDAGALAIVKLSDDSAQGARYANAAAASATNAANSETNAAASASVAAAAMNSASAPYANAYASTLPKGVTSIAITAGGSGGTDGTYALGVSGGPTGFAGTYTISGGAVTAITITNPGLSTATTAPTLSFPSGSVTGATATATVSSLIADQKTYWVASADSSQVLLYGNNGGSVATAPFGGTQLVLYGKAGVDAVATRVFGYPDIATGKAATAGGQKFRVISPGSGIADAEYLVGVSPNLFDVATMVDSGHYVGNTGAYANDAAWGCSKPIPVTVGQQYTLSGTRGREGIAFYSDAGGTTLVSGSYNGSTTLPLTVTAPAGAVTCRFNLYSNTATSYSNIQFEQGAAATAYQAYGTKTTTLVRQFASWPLTIPNKSYEQVSPSQNLFNIATMVDDGHYLTNSGVYGNSTGWGCSKPIPVTAGLQYTLSGARSREGVAFYSDAGGTNLVSGSYNGVTTLPLTVTAPAGAVTCRFNLYTSSSTTYSNIQFEQGAVATQYIPYGTSLYAINKAYLTPSVADVVTSLKATLSTSTSLGQANWQFPLGSHTVNINFSPNIPLNHTSAQIFQFYSSSFDGVLQASYEGDNIAPAHVEGTTISAGHGYARTICTLTAHGKTAADLYSEWQDGSSNRWIIILIDSANAFSVTAKTGNGAFAGGALTHVSGASNTATVTPTSVAQDQLYPSIANRQFRMDVDGQPRTLANETIYPRNSMTFLETYEILNKDSMIAWLIANKTGADIAQYGGTSDIALSMSYRFDDQGVVQTGDYLALQNVSAFTDLMFIQSYKLDEGTGNGTLKYYIPNALSFVQDSVTYDFANGQDMTSYAPVNPLYITPARSEVAPAILPDRVLMKNDKLGIAVGVLPVQDADPSVRRTNVSRYVLEIRNNTKKIYHRVIDRADKTSLTAGDYYSAVTYRRYFDPTQPRWFYTVPYGTTEYVYIHWYNKSLTDAVPMPARLAGRSFTVVDSHNATVKSKVVGSTLRVAVSASGSNAHVVLAVS